MLKSDFIRQPKSFITKQGSVYYIEPDGSTIRDKKERNWSGHEGDQGIKEKSHKTYYTKGTSAVLSAAGVVSQSQWLVLFKDGLGTLISKNKDGRWGAAPSSRDIPVFTTPELGRSPLEVWEPVDSPVEGYEAYRKMHAGSVIIKID